MTPDGTVYVSGEKGQIYRLEADDSATEVTTTGGWTLGLAADAEGRIYACDAGAPRRAALDARVGTARGLDERRRDAAVRACPTGVRSARRHLLRLGLGWPGRAVTVASTSCVEGRTSVWTSESRRLPQRPGGHSRRARAVGPGIDAGTAGRVRHRADGSRRPQARAARPARHRARRHRLRHRRLGPHRLLPAGRGAALAPAPALHPKSSARTPRARCWPRRPTAPSSGPDLRDIVAVPNIGRWHVTRFAYRGSAACRSSIPRVQQLGD